MSPPKADGVFRTQPKSLNARQRLTEDVSVVLWNSGMFDDALDRTCADGAWKARNTCTHQMPINYMLLLLLSTFHEQKLLARGGTSLTNFLFLFYLTRERYGMYNVNFISIFFSCFAFWLALIHHRLS